MNKFENVDVLASLQQIMQQNTAAFQNDFDIDKKILTQAAKSKNAEDKVYLWFSRPNGTHCLRERDKRLFALLPYKTLYLPSVKDRHGVFAFISKDERRDLPLRKQHPSVRAQLKEEQSKKSAAPKKAAAKAKDNDLEV